MWSITNRHPNRVYSLLSLLLRISVISAGSSDESYASCDEYSTLSSKSASALTPNTFHKICPPVLPESQALGQPICGDGTAFSFFYTSPTQRLLNTDKIIIEFMGGGACWDANTCDEQSSLLTFPEALNNFAGYSCSEAEYGMETAANLLCTSKFGDVDMTEYNTIIVPYCSQDVHMGDSQTNYGDDDGDAIYHHGAHNIMSVFNWVYQNFPNPSHIALTGCSAGGTVLPIAYDILNNHYNTVFDGGRTVNINVLLDSPVYLTPEYFLTYGLDNWNPWTVLEIVRFKYSEWQYDIQYSTKLWEHVLERGSNSDQWGFLSHTYDDTSLTYWQAMGGNYGGDDDGADQSNWYSNTMESLNSVMTKYKNVDTFFMDSNGHCTFGLYYGLEEDGFEEWAEGIFKEQKLLLRITSSFPMFLLSVVSGVGLILAAFAARKEPSDVKSDNLLNQENQKVTTKPKIASALAPIISAAGRFKSCPITSGYFVATSFYFLCMVVSNGFTHPINNPSLGPSATTLSLFGINNPTLIVDGKQVHRLLMSTFLCSGVLTYIMILHSTLRCVRHLERILDNSKVFATACLGIAFSSNLIYALVSEGASCSSMAFVLGLNCFSIGMAKGNPDLEFPSPLFLTIIQTLFSCFLFPFNNFIMILTGMFTGAFILPRAFKVEMSSDASEKPVISFNNVLLLGIGGTLGLIFILLLAGVPNPNEMYEHPFVTGCSMKYSLNIQDIAEQLTGGGDRKLKEDDYDGLCAQICVPHLIDRPLSWSIAKFSDYSFLDGWCSEIGYETHVADKTYSYWGYPLDVEMYYETNVDE